MPLHYCNRKQHRNFLEFHKESEPEPFRSLQSICTGPLRNLTKHVLRQNPEPHKVSAPELYGTSHRYLPRDPPRNLT